MTRESRLLLVIGLLAVVGVTSLLLIADRFRRVVAAAPDVVQDSRDSPGEDADDGLRRAAAKDLVARFIAIRAAVAGIAIEHRAALAAAVDPQTGRLRADASAELVDRHAQAVDAIRSRRAMAIDRHGMSEADYDGLRVAYLAWRSGQAVDPVLQHEFDARRAQLEPLRLGPFESLDQAAPSR